MNGDPDYDVVIVGAGAGGGAAAWALCAKGAKVLLLEAGPVFDPVADYRLHRSDWERSAFPVGKARHQGRYVYAPMQVLDPAWNDLRSWNAVIGATNPGERRKADRYHHVRGVGGSTLHFQGDAHRRRRRSRHALAASATRRPSAAGTSDQLREPAHRSDRRSARHAMGGELAGDPVAAL